ncbi:MAG: hypothetical protein ACRD5F_13950 [Candidatus Acidiferrales bacterium]
MNRKAIFSVVAVFVLGALLGGLAVYAWTERVHGAPIVHTRKSSVVRLTEALDLTPPQQEQVRAILSATKSQFDVTYDTIRPQMDAIRQQGRQQIRAILAPEQLPRFEEHLRQLDEERKRKGR